MKFVPAKVERVLPKAYVVQAGDTVGSIATGFTGSPLRCAELVGANFHKRLGACQDVPNFVFAELAEGEALNLPDDWISPWLGVSGTKQTTGLVGQTNILADVFKQVLNTGDGIGWPNPTAPIDQLASTMVGMWPYLGIPPNGFFTGPSALTYEHLMTWILGTPVGNWDIRGGFPKTAHLAAFTTFVSVADRITSTFGPLPSFRWDSVPWSKAQDLMNAVGNRPDTLRTLLSLSSRVAGPQIEWQLSVNPSAAAKSIGTSGAPSCQGCAAPRFDQVDTGSSSTFTQLMKWFTDMSSNGVDPTKVPWDLLTDPDTLNCLRLYPNRVAEMQADTKCYPNVPAACGDALTAFRASLCAATYEPGWCEYCGATDITTKMCLEEGKMPCALDSDCCQGLVCKNTICRRPGYVVPGATPGAGGGGIPQPVGVNKEGQTCNLDPRVNIGCERGLACVNGVCTRKTGAVTTPPKTSTSPITVMLVAAGAFGLAFLGYKELKKRGQL